MEYGDDNLTLHEHTIQIGSQRSHTMTTHAHTRTHTHWTDRSIGRLHRSLKRYMYENEDCNSIS